MHRLIGFAVLWIWMAIAANAAAPKNIILFIGDGMGVSQVSAGKIAKGTLNLEQFKVMGLVTTYSQSALVTDSAAAGTALATGHKTYNGAISVSVKKRPLKSVLEYAEARGKSTGLVTTCSLTHATPAVFAAHVDSRKKNAQIAEQIAKSGVDVLFGGGLAYFLPESAEGSQRRDEKDLVALLQKRMPVVRSAEAFERLGKVRSAAGFFAPVHPPRAGGRRPKLAELTKKAIEILSKNPKGFFLMVEGSQIDWAGHKNDQDYLIAETVDFDDAVGEGLVFAAHDSGTLIIVTADHETGGFAVHDGDVDARTVSEAAFTWTHHTATMVPLFARGPGSADFAGIRDNTHIGKTLIGYMEE